MNINLSREDSSGRRRKSRPPPQPPLPPQTLPTISGTQFQIGNFFRNISRITFKQTDIDWPSCINYIEFDYYDTVYNESVFMETLRSPLPETVELEIVNKKVPCDGDFAHFTRVYGATGDFSKGFWTPPSCLTTTPTPTTPSGSSTTTTIADDGALYRAQSENWELKEQIGALR